MLKHRFAPMVGVLLIITACGTTSTAPDAVLPTNSSTSTATIITTAPSSAGYPVTIENCGRKLTFAKAPERVISLWQPPTEMLLALGLGDRIVAVGGNYDDYPANLQAEAATLKQIGTAMQWPVKEVTLAENPDFVISEQLEGFAFDSNSGYATVAELEAAGAQVYSNNACTMADAGSKRLEQVYTDLAHLGAIFGVSERADAIITDLQSRQAAIEQRMVGAAPVNVLFYTGGEGPLNVLSGGVWGDLIVRAGGKNVFDQDVFQVSAEEFAAAQPDVILLGTFPGQDAAMLESYLKTTFPSIPAVQNNRLIPIPTINTEASIRIIDGLEQIARALHPEVFE